MFISDTLTNKHMPKGIPVTRGLNVQAATLEGKKVLLQTKSWPQTKEHLYGWIKSRWGLSRTTVTDYTEDVYIRLLKDPQTKPLLEMSA